RELGSFRLQDFANDVGVLVDDGGVRTDVDNTIHIPFSGVVQRKTQTGERLTSSSWNGQEAGPFRADRGRQAGFRDLLAQFVDRGSFGKTFQLALQKVCEHAPFGVAFV